MRLPSVASKDVYSYLSQIGLIDSWTFPPQLDLYCAGSPSSTLLAVPMVEGGSVSLPYLIRFMVPPKLPPPVDRRVLREASTFCLGLLSSKPSVINTR